MYPFVNGLLFGLVFLFALGPAFFALIQTSIQYGFKKAILFAVGISLSDVLFIVLVLLGMASFLQSEDFKLWMAVFGVVMLIAYSVYSWFKRPVVYSETDLGEDNKSAKHFLKGLLLNGLNPFIIVSWATVVSAVAINFEYDFNQQIQFFLGMLVTILSMDIGKAFVAHRLKHLVTQRFVQVMNRTIAVILALFAGRIVYYLIENFL